MSADEIRRFRESIDIKALYGLRFRTLIEVLLGTGMRISEALSLNRNDIDFQNKEALVVGKGNKQRAMFFFAITYGNKLTKKLIIWSEKTEDGDNIFLSLTLVLVLVFSALAEKIGIHAVLGAFLVGLAFSNCEPHKMHNSLRKVVMSVFSPLYFVSVGLGINLIKNFDLTLALIVLGIVIIGKVGGVWIGAKISKLSDRESLAVGFGMNARGAVGIILVTSAHQAGIIDERVYVALLVMAIVTSLISGPRMKMILKKT